MRIEKDAKAYALIVMPDDGNGNSWRAMIEAAFQAGVNHERARLRSIEKMTRAK